MAPCVKCKLETSPGDLVTRLVDGEWMHFCSEQCHTEFTHPKVAAEKPVDPAPDAAPSPQPAKRRHPRSKSAS